MILQLDWQETVETVRIVGIDAFLVMLQEEYPNLDLYKISLNWLEDKSYACKVRGSEGDMSIRWL